MARAAKKSYNWHLCPECQQTFTNNKYYCDFCRSKLTRPPMPTRKSLIPRQREEREYKWRAA